METKVISLSAEDKGTIELDERVFGLQPRPDLVQRLVVYQLAKRRSGTRRTKTRGEIARTGAKFGRQKGGGARHGSKRAPIFRGGGRAHGPVVRSHETALPRRVRALALRHVLSAKYSAGQLAIIDNAGMDKISTASAAKSLKGLGLNSVVFVDSDLNREFCLSVRNVPNVDVLAVAGLNGYDVLRRERLVLTLGALKDIQENLS